LRFATYKSKIGGSQVPDHLIAAFFIMPKELERKLRTQARKRGLKGKRADAYVYGTMQRVTSWKPHKKKGTK